MAIREIVFLPDPVLRQKARRINEIDKEIQGLVADMIETMREAPGVGLAAPQVGVSLRLVVVEFGDEEDETVPPKLYTVINPEIIKASSEMVKGVEACLSVPGLAGVVDRHQAITVKGLNRFGQAVRIKADGWLARIFQHEIDHLDGVVFTDLAERIWQPEESEEYADV